MTQLEAKASEFWRDLGDKHRAELEEHGMDKVKRHQAFYYFNWSWTWAGLRQNPQIKALLAGSSPSTIARCLAARPQLSQAAWHGTTLGTRDRLLYTYAVRLLWEYARKHGESAVLGLPEPAEGDPLPVFWDGRLISQDLANSALEAEAILRALKGKRPDNIVEVGAGYGRSAYALLHLFPDATYTVIDIEPAISISKWYLGQLFPPERLRFFSPTEIQNIPTGTCSLAMSISSLQEMTWTQISTYLQLFDRIAAGGTVFLKQWREWFNPVDKLLTRFSEYPIPARWSLLFRETARIQTGFEQAGWAVPSSPPDPHM